MRYGSSFRRSSTAHHSCPSGLRCVVSVHVNKKQKVESNPKRKKKPNLVKEIKQTQDQRYQTSEPVRKPREIETCDKNGGFWRRFSRMEILFLIFLTLVSNQNNKTPRILHTNSGPHAHTHPHSQYTMNKTTRICSEKERER